MAKRTRKAPKQRKASKKTASKKTQTTKGRPRAAAAAREGSVEEWLEGVRTFAASRTAAAAPRGACLVTDPNGGPAMCVSVDRQTCDLMKGRWIGGPC